MGDGQSLVGYLHQSMEAIRKTADTLDESRFDSAVDIIAGALADNRPVLACGNGGSAADAQHLAAELVGRYERERRAYNVLALAANEATMTALANDYGFEQIFARQVEAYGAPGGALIAISTSGRSANVLRALERARGIGMKTISLTGAHGDEMAQFSDVVLQAASDRTAEIQQVHLCLYHLICSRVEQRLA